MFRKLDCAMHWGKLGSFRLSGMVCIHFDGQKQEFMFMMEKSQAYT